MSQNNSQQIITAAAAKLVAQREEAKAVLLTYTTNAVGVADHSGIVDEVVEWTKKITEANDCLDTLQKLFSFEKATTASEQDDNNR